MGAAVLISKFANFLVADVQLKPSKLKNALDVSGAVDVAATASVLESFRKAYGGLWVGGRVTVTSTEVRLSANAMNRALTSGTMDIALPLPQIQEVTVEGGFITKIIRLDTTAGSVKFRCYGARGVADLIKSSMLEAKPI